MTAKHIHAINLGRDTGLALGTLFVFGLLRGAFSSDVLALLTGQPLPFAFMQYLDPSIAFFLFVPLFCFCIFRKADALLAACSATRFSSRGQLFRTLEAAVALRALLFATIIVATTLPFLLVQGNNGTPSALVAPSALLQVLFQTMFFLTTGTIYVAVRLICGAGAIPFAASLFYAGVDALIQTLELINVRALWTGWLIIGYADPSQPLLALSGLLRLGALFAISALVALRTMTKLDLLVGSGSNAEA